MITYQIHNIVKKKYYRYEMIMFTNVMCCNGFYFLYFNRHPDDTLLSGNCSIEHQLEKQPVSVVYRSNIFCPYFFLRYLETLYNRLRQCKQGKASENMKC